MAESPTNQPTGYVRYNRSGSKLQEWSGAAWVDIVFSIAGGGTGGSTASAARTALGLGTMATQDNTAVNITGGTISGVSMSASVLTSGTVALNRGGTGASLTLGSIGQPMMSNGSGVVFADGDQIAKLNASNLTTGTVPLTRLANIADSNISTIAAIQWSKISKVGGLLTDLGGTLGSTALSGGTFSGSIAFSGAVAVGSLGVIGNASLSGSTDIPGDYNVNFNSNTEFTTATPGGVGVSSPVGWIGVRINGLNRKIAFWDA
jgi:hypothetical protein